MIIIIIIVQFWQIELKPIQCSRQGYMYVRGILGHHHRRCQLEWAFYFIPYSMVAAALCAITG